MSENKFKNAHLKRVKDKLVYSSDKGWHLPVERTHTPTMVGGTSRFFAGSEKERIEFVDCTQAMPLVGVGRRKGA